MTENSKPTGPGERPDPEVTDGTIRPEPEKSDTGSDDGGASTGGATAVPAYEPPTDQPPAYQPEVPPYQPEGDQPVISGGVVGADDEDGPRKRGSISYQDPETTTTREPTLAEQRARREALRREREAEVAAQQEAEDKARKRKRILIGTGVTIGVVAVVAVIYTAVTRPKTVTAVCTQNGVVVNDDYCDESYATSHGGYYSGGFYYIGGSSYRYNYGGSGTIGQPVSGGSYTAPSGNTQVKTASGKSVSRGGLGVGGSGSGGKSGGS